MAALEEVFNEWDTLTKAPQRPKTLDLDYINLVRLIVIYIAPVDVAKLLLENNPFSPSLNAAINKCKTK